MAIDPSFVMPPGTFAKPDDKTFEPPPREKPPPSRTAMAERPDTTMFNDWRDTNLIFQKMRSLRNRTFQLIDGRFYLLIVYGPPGLGKTVTIKSCLGRYHRAELAKWERAQDKSGMRRSRWTYDGRSVFNEPYRFIHGSVSYPEFFYALYWTSYVGEVLVIEDCDSLRDSRIQGLIRSATDTANRGHVRYNFKAKLPDGVEREFDFRGCLIIITNFRKDDPDGSAMVRELFTPEVRSRSREVEFDWDYEAIYEFTTRLAFGTEPKQGLYKFLIAPTQLENSAIHPDDNGCGFKGSHEECVALLKEIYQFWMLNWKRAKEISFRELRRWVDDRVLYPMDDEWKRVIERESLSKVPMR